METCTMPRVLSVMPTALTEGSPPLEARTVYAMALAISRFLLERFTLYAMSGRRAPTMVAPAVRCSFASPKSGAHSGFIRIRSASSSRQREEHTSELQSQSNLVCRLLLEKKKKKKYKSSIKTQHWNKKTTVLLEL